MVKPGTATLPDTVAARRLLALAISVAAVALLSAAQAPSPAPSPSISPSPTLTGTLKITKTDRSGTTIPLPGARFRIHLGSPTGQVVATVTTAIGTGSVTTTLPALPNTSYCLEEIAAPAGYEVMPQYDPDACIMLAAGETTTVKVSDPPVATASPSPTPSPTPSPPVTGELQITKVDTAGRTITTPGFTFNVRIGSANGPTIATIATDGSGIAVAGALNPATYCVEEISAPDGYQVAPTYSPSSCVGVASDPSQGRSPTIVTVADPPAATPTPSAGAVPVESPSATPRSGGPAVVKQPPSTPVATIASRAMIGLGILLLLGGAVMIVVAIRRRRRASQVPSEVWYDSTIT